MARNLNDVKYLIGHWPLNNNALDVSGYGNDGTWSGTEAYTEGPYGRSVGDFDGTSKVDITDTSKIHNLQDCTISFDLKINTFDVGGDDRIFDIGSSDTDRISMVSWTGGSNSLVYQHDINNDGTSVTLGTNLSVGHWYHIVISLGAKGIKTYLDGELAGTNANTKTISEIAGTLYASLAAKSFYAGSYAICEMSDFKIHDIQVTTDEVKRLYRQSRRTIK